MADYAIHPVEGCAERASHERWSVLRHVGDYGRRGGDIEATHELIVVRECRALWCPDEYACIATGFDSAADAKAWRPSTPPSL